MTPIFRDGSEGPVANAAGAARADIRYEMTVYGYARVSTTAQSLATQKAILAKAGVERICSEEVSGAAAKRPELEGVLNELEVGDVPAF